MEQPAQPTRPKSAAGRPRLSRTRSYINSREGKASAKDEGENVPVPFLEDNSKLQNNERNGDGDETAPLIFSLLGDLDDDGNAFLWETTRTVKPKNAFVNEMQFRFSLSGEESKLICTPTRLDLKSLARVPIALISLLCQHMAALLMTVFGYFSRCGIKRNDEKMPCVEDGLVTKSIAAPTTAKSRNLLRLEDRIRRELDIETKSPPLAATLSDQSVAAREDNAGIKDEIPEQRPVAKMDESFWMNPVNDLVGPEKSGNVQREVNLTIDVGPIKLCKHPEFTAQEQALAHVSCFDLSNTSVAIQSAQPSQIAEGVETKRRKVDIYFARLLVNGHVVGDTKTEAVDFLSFSVKLSHRFYCKLSQKPTSTCLQVWRSAVGFLPNEMVCSIGFLPNESACTQEDQLGSTSPAMETWLQFSSKGSDVKGVLRIGAHIVEHTLRSSVHMANMSGNLPQLIRSPGGIDTIKAASKLSSQHCSGLDRQSMMQFKHNSGILFTNKLVFEEPLRHSLIKKRQKSPTSVLSPIPITELEVQNNDAFHDLIKNDCPSNEVSSSSSVAFSLLFRSNGDAHIFPTF